MRYLIFILLLSLISCSVTQKSEKHEIKAVELKRIEKEIELFNSPENILKVKQLLLVAKYFKNEEELNNYEIILDPYLKVDHDCEYTTWKKMYYVDSTFSNLVNNDCQLITTNIPDTLEFLKKFRNKYPKANLDTIKLYEYFLTSDYTAILKPYKNNTIYSCIKGLTDSSDRYNGSYGIRLYSKMDTSFKFFYVSSHDNSINLSTDDTYLKTEKEKINWWAKWFIPKDCQVFTIIDKGGGLIDASLIIIKDKIYSEQCLRIKKRKILNLKDIIENHLDECEECEIDNYLRWRGLK